MTREMTSVAQAAQEVTGATIMVANQADTINDVERVQQQETIFDVAVRTNAYVAQLDKVYNVVTRQYMSIQGLARKLSPSGGDISEMIAELLSDERGMTKVDTITYEPGKEVVYEDENMVSYLNLWTPPGLEPVPGDVSPLHRHLNLIFNDDQEAVKYMLDYTAHILQKPSTKIMCAPLIIGGQGIGKSMFGEFLARLLGSHNTTFIEMSDLASQFNSYARSQLIIVNEFTSAATKATRALLKSLITSPTINMNQKNIAAVQIPNRSNLILFSNDPAALPLERDDRRYFVCISRAERQPAQYYKDLHDWMAGEGAAHALHYLLTRDISGFNPNAAPPSNASREALIHEAMSDQHQLLLELYEAGEPPFASPLAITSDVAEYMNSLRGPRFTVRHIAAFFQQIGAAALGQCRIVDTDGTVRKPRVWAVSDIKSWEHRAEGDISRHYVKPTLQNTLIRRATATPAAQALSTQDIASQLQ